MVLLRLWRPSQWTKNLIVLAGLIFAQQLLVLPQLERALLAVVCFCLASGGIYAINDVRDAAADRKHPEKRRRPVASGAIAPGAATLWGVGSLLAALGLARLLPGEFLVAVAAYELLMLAYTFGLKRVVIADVLTLAVGFVIRAYAGAAAVRVEFSHWLLLATLLLALLLALGKRMAELRTVPAGGGFRAVLDDYSRPLLERLIGVSTSAAIVVYALYTVSADTVKRFGSDRLKYTLVFVLFGLFRYLYLLDRGVTAAPELLVVKDPPLLLALVLWAAAVLGLVYLPRVSG